MIADNGLCSTPFTDWVCAPVEIDNKYLQPRLRLAIAVVSPPGRHVGGLSDAVIDVIRDVGELRFAAGKVNVKATRNATYIRLTAFIRLFRSVCVSPFHPLTRRFRVPLMKSPRSADVILCASIALTRSAYCSALIARSAVS